MKYYMFLELLQVAVGRRRCLSKVLTGEDWGLMYGLFKKHALLGIGYVAIQKLPREQWPHANIVLPLTAYATQIKAKNAKLNEECREVVRQMEHDGIGAVVIKGQSNLENYPEELREYRNPGDIDVWTTLINDEGLRINDSVHTRDKDWCPQADSLGEQQLFTHCQSKEEFIKLKQVSSIGQQLSKKYSCTNSEGEIPIAVQTGDSVEYEYYKGVRGIIEYARLQRRLREDKSLFKPLYYHVEYHTDKGTEVEMHYRPSFLCSPIRNMRMQRWFKEQFDVCLKNKGQLGFPVLTSSVNVVYQLVHLYRHVFEGGIGLRQLMDYYFALRVWHNDVMECKDLQSQGMWSEGMGTPVMSKEEVISVLSSFGMSKFTAAVMYVLQEVFAMPTHYYICKPNEKEGRKLLAEIMQGGNFGQYDTRDAALKKGGMVKHGIWKLKRVMKLVSSYPEEALWEPVFRVYHLIWRRING